MREAVRVRQYGVTGSVANQVTYAPYSKQTWKTLTSLDQACLVATSFKPLISKKISKLFHLVIRSLLVPGIFFFFPSTFRSHSSLYIPFTFAKVNCPSFPEQVMCVHTSMPLNNLFSWSEIPFLLFTCQHILSSDQMTQWSLPNPGRRS